MKKKYITMSEKEVNDLVSCTVNSTVLKLKLAGLMKDDLKTAYKKTAYKKTEELLRNYRTFQKSDQPYTVKLVHRMDEAMAEIQNDIYYEIIPMAYFSGDTREAIADHFGTTVTTISRNKNRLVNKLKVALFSDDAIMELFIE